MSDTHRLEVIRSRTVLDHETGLQWMLCSLGQKLQKGTCSGAAAEINYTKADAILKKINYELAFDGYNDWRVPKRHELEKWVKVNADAGSVKLDTNSTYWAISDNPDDPRLWAVSTIPGVSSQQRPPNAKAKFILVRKEENINDQSPTVQPSTETSQDPLHSIRIDPKTSKYSVVLHDAFNRLIESTVQAVNYKQWSFITLVLMLLLISWFGIVDHLSTAYVDQSLVQATVAFGLSKTINAVVSVMQSTTLSFSIFGGVALGVGEVLDPINDLVEQYASMMKLAIGSLIIQKLLIEITSDLIFRVAITVSGVLLVASVLMRSLSCTNVLAKLFAFLVFLRFAIVLTILMNGVVDRLFIDDIIEQEISVLNQVVHETEQDLHGMQRLLDQGEDLGFFEAIRAKIQQFASRAAVMRDVLSIDNIKMQIDDISDNMLRIMSIFIFKTLILPLLFLFILTKSTKIIWGLDLNKLFSK